MIMTRRAATGHCAVSAPVSFALRVTEPDTSGWPPPDDVDQRRYPMDSTAITVALSSENVPSCAGPAARL